LDSDNLGHFTIIKFQFCPNCGADKFAPEFGCWSCGGQLAKADKEILVVSYEGRACTDCGLDKLIENGFCNCCGAKQKE